MKNVKDVSTMILYKTSWEIYNTSIRERYFHGVDERTEGPTQDRNMSTNGNLEF